MSLARLKQIIESRLGSRQGVVRSVSTLVSGTAFAQGATILAMPILTRLYTPGEFSLLAVYASLLSILTVIACLRLEIAIPLPENDEKSSDLLFLALSGSLISSLLVGLVIWLWNAPLVRMMGVPAFAPFMWMVPLGVWFASSYAAIQFWATRKTRFSHIARTRVTQAISGLGTQIGTGALGWNTFGLLLGHMIGSGVAALSLAKEVWREDRLKFCNMPSKRIFRTLIEYSKFPKYSALEALANTAGTQLPVIIIAAIAIGPEAGYLMLAMRVMAAPMGLVGTSIAQVYLAHAPHELRVGRLGPFTTTILNGLVKTGVGPLLFAGIIAAPAFAYIFGSEWRRAGELVGWMTPWFILQFLSSPVSMVMHITGRLISMLRLAFSGLVIRVGAIYVAYKFNPEIIPETYALSGAVFYLICFLCFYRAASVQVHLIFRQPLRNWIPLASWISSGILLRLVLEALS